MPVSTRPFVEECIKRAGGPYALALRGYRCREGLTQKAVAQLAGISVKALSSMECGRSIPSVADAKKLAAVFRCKWQKLTSDIVE